MSAFLSPFVLITAVLSIIVLLQSLFLWQSRQNFLSFKASSEASLLRMQEQNRVMQSGMIGLGKQVQLLNKKAKEPVKSPQSKPAEIAKSVTHAPKPMAKEPMGAAKDVKAQPATVTGEAAVNSQVKPEKPRLAVEKSRESTLVEEDPYQQAERMLKQGADVARIVDRTGLSYAEVQLLSMINQSTVITAA